MIRDAIDASQLCAPAPSGAPDHLWRLASESADARRRCRKTLSTSWFGIRAKRRWWKFCSRQSSGCDSRSGGGLLVQAGRPGIHRNPDRPSAPSQRCPRPAYDLIDFDVYERSRRRAQTALRHQHRLPLRLQLLHRHGLLQPALQSL